MIELENRIAIVTGGSRGIGRAIAGQLAECGAHVVIASRSIESCEQAASEIISQGGKAQAIACNTGSLEDLENLVTLVAQQHNRIDVLVNNSAANPWFGPVIDLQPDVFHKNIEVNLQGTLFASIYAARVMREHGGGAIINIGSINAIKPVIGQSIYSICKGGINTMTLSLAKEFAEYGIRVNTVAPGITKTDALEGLFQGAEELPDKWRSQIPLKRHANPEQIAGAVAFLASDSASYITGACITADGGLTL